MEQSQRVRSRYGFVNVHVNRDYYRRIKPNTFGTIISHNKNNTITVKFDDVEEPIFTTKIFLENIS